VPVFVLAGIFDAIADVAQSTWAYLVVPAIILVDAFVGVLPAETVLHAAGVGAAQGQISVVVLVVEAFIAAVVADLALYTVGSKGSGRIRGWIIRGDRSRRRYEATCRQLYDRTWLLTVARFVPGLRTVTMLAAGTTKMGRSRFLAYEAPGALLWAVYNVLLGYFLGQVFQSAGFWVPLLVSAAVASVLALSFELARRAKLGVQDAG
jgi:membrane-associated protein